MSDLRTAAQQALNALVLMRDRYEEYACPACDHADAATYALRAALDQPDHCPNCASLEAQNTELDRKLAALERPEQCRYPDCVDNGPEGKCIRWLTDECSGPEGGQA